MASHWWFVVVRPRTKPLHLQPPLKDVHQQQSMVKHRLKISFWSLLNIFRYLFEDFNLLCRFKKCKMFHLRTITEKFKKYPNICWCFSMLRRECSSRTMNQNKLGKLHLVWNIRVSLYCSRKLVKWNETSFNHRTSIKSIQRPLNSARWLNN
jgi:hypothetical protein